MISLKDIRQWISDLGIAADERVYIGKLDNKQQELVGVYERKGSGPPVTALGGFSCATYDTRRLSLLIHWNKRKSESEAAAWELYEKLKTVDSLTIGNTFVSGLILQVPEPVDVGTDDDGVYEYVIWLDLIYNKEEVKT